jgi:hypothetical protein
VIKECFIVAAVLGVVASHATAQARDVAADEATIRQLAEQGRLAVLNRDWATLERLWSDDFIVNPPSNPGEHAVLEPRYQGASWSSSSETVHVFPSELDVKVTRADALPTEPRVV